MVKSPQSGGNDALGEVMRKNSAALSVMTANIQRFFTAIDEGLASVQRNVARFVELANPAAVIQFNYAVKDMQAAIGQALTPVLNNATRLVRALGDSIISLSPHAKAAIAAIASLAVGFTVAAIAAGALSAIINSAFAGIPAIIGSLVGLAVSFGLFDGVSKEMKGILTSLSNTMEIVFGAFTDIMAPLFSIVKSLIPVLAPLIEMFVIFQTTALKPIIFQLQIWAAIFEGLKPIFDLVTEALNKFIRTIKEILGIKDPEKKSSVGAAMRNTTIGSLDSFLSEQTRKSFQGAAQVEDKLSTEINAIGLPINEMKGYVKGIYDEILSYKNSAKQAVSAAGDAGVTGARYGAFGGIGRVATMAADARKMWNNLR